MVKVYGTGAASGAAPKQNIARQLAIVLAVCAMALAVCVALISTSELKASRPVALYGLGSGEEQDAENSIVTTFETFAGQDEWMEELLGDEYYVELFAEIADSEPITEAIDEVTVAVDEAKNEHEILQTFAEGADAPLE
jgi:hypothetical protein